MSLDDFFKKKHTKTLVQDFNLSLDKFKETNDKFYKDRADAASRALQRRKNYLIQKQKGLEERLAYRKRDLQRAPKNVKLDLELLIIDLEDQLKQVKRALKSLK